MNMVNHSMLMYNFLLCQKKTNDKSLILPDDINYLICQNLAVSVHAHRKADYISTYLDPRNINNKIKTYKWCENLTMQIHPDPRYKDLHLFRDWDSPQLHRECDLPAFIKTGKYNWVSWWQNGLLSRDNKPAVIFNDCYCGKKFKAYVYVKDGIVSRYEIVLNKYNKLKFELPQNNCFIYYEANSLYSLLNHEIIPKIEEHFLRKRFHAY